MDFYFGMLIKESQSFIQIENDYGYKTIRVEDGEVKSKMSFVPRFGNLKVKHRNTSVEQLRLIELDLRKKYSEDK